MWPLRRNDPSTHQPSLIHEYWADLGEFERGGRAIAEVSGPGRQWYAPIGDAHYEYSVYPRAKGDISERVYTSFESAVEDARATASKAFIAGHAKIPQNLFGMRRGRPVVDAIAVMQHTDGWKLVQTNAHLDSYHRFEPPSIFDSGKRYVAPKTGASRVSTTIDALVSHELLADFRGAEVGRLVKVKHFPFWRL